MPYFHMEIKQGSDYEVSFTAKDPDTDLPINLTAGYVLSGRIAKRFYSLDPPLYEWTQAVGNIVGQNGTFVVRVLGSVSKLWTFRRVVFDIKIINSGSGAEVISVHGPLTVNPSLS